jgi:integrase
MSLSLKRRRRTWYAVGQVNGQRVNQSLKTTDRTVAEALKRDLELQILAGGRLSRRLWKDFREEFLNFIASQVSATPHSTFDKYTFVLNRFTRYLADAAVVELNQIQPATIAGYCEARRQDIHPKRGIPVGPEGLKHDLRVLHRIFSYAQECGYLEKNPVLIKDRDTVAGKTLPFPEEEVALILSDGVVARQPQLRAIVLTFLFTGFRISDVIRLPLSSLDLKNNRIVHMPQKTRKRRKIVTITLHSELRAALEVHLAYRNEKQKAAGWVFATVRGKPIVGLDDILRRLFKRCGIEGGRAHRFRDTFAVRLLALGASLYDVAKLLGITVKVAERHYAPYVKELQERGANLIAGLSVPVFVSDSPKSFQSPQVAKVVQFCAPVSTTSSQKGETPAKTDAGATINQKS